jgi:hypothetical protein
MTERFNLEMGSDSESRVKIKIAGKIAHFQLASELEVLIMLACCQ